MNNPEKPINRSLGRIVLCCLLLGLPIAGAFLIIERRIENMEVANNMQILKLRESQYLNQQTQLVEYILQYIKNDVRFLSHLPPVYSVLQKENRDHLADKIFFSLLETYGNYDQIRLLNVSGDEVLRINYNGGSPQIVPKDKLQNKASRYYFSDAMAVSADLIAMSPLDLNMEHGKVEIPYKPTIRISTPIDDGDKRYGVLVMNFLGKKLLDLMNALQFSRNASVGLLNQDGYWLQGLNAEDSWGFMFPDRLDRNIFTTMPEEAEKIYAEDAGQFQTKLGLISFATIRPMAHKEGISSKGLDFWKIISVLPAEAVDQIVFKTQKHLSLVSWMIVPAIFLATLALSVFIEERRVLNQQIRKESLVDKITGTWNRRYMTEYIAKLSPNEQTALALVDLGNFKKVNDQLGHNVGDQVLRQVAEIFQRGVRSLDKVSRHGGDEYLNNSVRFLLNNPLQDHPSGNHNEHVAKYA